MAISILVVEDDEFIQELIAEFLRTQNYHVEIAGTGVAGYEKFVKGSYELVILDVMLPEMDGYNVCRLIRKMSDIPIIFLTALGEEADQLQAFELEADDYITKPFSFNILTKRVEAVLRRAGRLEKNRVLSVGELRLNPETYMVWVDNTQLEVTSKEFEILQTLMENKGIPLSREVLLDKVWGYSFVGDLRIVDAHIKNIRRKLREKTHLPYIATVKGVGYKVENPQS